MAVILCMAAILEKNPKITNNKDLPHQLFKKVRTRNTLFLLFGLHGMGEKSRSMMEVEAHIRRKITLLNGVHSHCLHENLCSVCKDWCIITNIVFHSKEECDLFYLFISKDYVVCTLARSYLKPWYHPTRQYQYWIVKIKTILKVKLV